MQAERASEQDRDTDATRDFLALRGRLARLAYRMTGSVADAEDIVQESWLRWRGAGEPQPQNPAAYFSTIVTRLCLDRMKRAARTRERYVGVWLPEPAVAEWSMAEQNGDRIETPDISYAIMMLMERLSPLERAAYLLHDLFDMPFGEIAAILERTPATCRKLASRARAQIEAGERRYRPGQSDIARLTAAFLEAVGSGDTAALQSLFADDIVFLGDGGGKLPATLNPIRGADAVARLLLGLARKQAIADADGFRPASVNGAPGFIQVGADGNATSFAFDLDADGRFAGIYSVRNPDKVRHLRPVAG